MELRGPFDGFVEKAVRAIIPCLIMADHNRYSVDARAAGRTVLVRAALPRSTVSCSNWASMSRSPRFRSKSQMAAIQTQAKELGAVAQDVIASAICAI